MPEYAIIKSKESSLTASEIVETTNNQAIPILWINSEGRYCLLSKEVVQNLLDLHEPLRQAQDPEYKSPTLQIVWSQGVEVDGRVGRILAGE